MNDIKGEFREVIESYTEVLEKDPQNIDAYLGRGMAKTAIIMLAEAASISTS